MSKTKQRERPNECITLMAHSVYALCHKGILYAHTWGFCVARFDISGNAKAYTQGTSNKELAPHLNQYVFCKCL